ncbi:glycoside hydrolase superfamily [Zopfochytrium polystomum]|nr:glycoside hydrolase superfamily [Zopfochytrium polystomum]
MSRDSAACAKPPHHRKRALSPFSTLAAALVVLASAAILVTVTPTTALGLYEPADGKLIIGAWVDTQDPKDSPSGGDSPSQFNARIGNSAGAFMFTQDIPLEVSPYTGATVTANLSAVEATNTDAILIITVYPKKGFSGYNDSDVKLLVDQLDNISRPDKSSRKVMLRFAPEMNGNWFSYGQQPKAFVAAFRDLVTKIRAQTKRVGIIWAPNAGNNYPFGDPRGDADVATLDTSGNQKLDNDDDPYSPYWPGEEYVDWIALSLYWKGFLADGYPHTVNNEAPAGFVETMIQGGQEGPNPKFPFYTMFAQKYKKPMMISEGGAAFQMAYTNPTTNTTTTLAPGVGRLALQRSYWRSYLTNATFASTYPLFKLTDLFEFVKTEDGGVTRDFRVSVDAETVAALKADISGAGAGRFAWAGGFRFGMDPTGTETLPTGTATGTVTATASTTKSAATAGGAWGTRRVGVGGGGGGRRGVDGILFAGDLENRKVVPEVAALPPGIGLYRALDDDSVGGGLMPASYAEGHPLVHGFNGLPKQTLPVAQITVDLVANMTTKYTVRRKADFEPSWAPAAFVLADIQPVSTL